MFDEMTEDDNLVRYAHRDADAFAVLYRRHNHRVYSYLMSRVGHREDAQDLTAQTFLAVLESLPMYRGQGNFVGWMLGIARHKAADYYRRQPPFIQTELDQIVLLDSARLEALVEQQLTMQTVAKLLRQINPERAEALRLRIFGEMKMSEIAGVMGKSEGAVKMLVARALDDLRQMLQSEREITS